AAFAEMLQLPGLSGGRPAGERTSGAGSPGLTDVRGTHRGRAVLRGGADVGFLFLTGGSGSSKVTDAPEPSPTLPLKGPRLSSRGTPANSRLRFSISRSSRKIAASSSTYSFSVSSPLSS